MAREVLTMTKAQKRAERERYLTRWLMVVVIVLAHFGLVGYLAYTIVDMRETQIREHETFNRLLSVLRSMAEESPSADDSSSKFRTSDHPFNGVWNFGTDDKPWVSSPWTVQR
jgi:hypothetical protein